MMQLTPHLDSLLPQTELISVTTSLKRNLFCFLYFWFQLMILLMSNHVSQKPALYPRVISFPFVFCIYLVKCLCNLSSLVSSLFCFRLSCLLEKRGRVLSLIVSSLLPSDPSLILQPEYSVKYTRHPLSSGFSLSLEEASVIWILQPPVLLFPEVKFKSQQNVARGPLHF